MRHLVLPATTKLCVEEDPDECVWGELFYFVPPVQPTSVLVMEAFQSNSTDALLTAVNHWIHDHFGGDAKFEELPE